MAERMTPECVTAQQHHIHGQNERAHSHPKYCRSSRWVCEPEGFPDIMREKENKEQREIQKIAMHVLHNERERTLAEIRLAWFTDTAGGRISPERFVISAAV